MEELNVAISFFVCGRTVYIYTDTPIKWIYMYIY